MELGSKLSIKNAMPIKSCRACHAEKMLDVLSLGDQHVSDFVTAAGDSPIAPLNLVRCAACGLVQLSTTFPRELLYRQYWYRSGISSSMKMALEDIVSKACDIAAPIAGDLVIDIGCNDGTLLASYKKSGLQRVGFEPAKNLVADARKVSDYVFNDFFSYHVFTNKYDGAKAKIITSIAMFYDLDDPNTFVSDVAKCLDSSGIWVIQQNYLPAMLSNNGFDNIGHEHLTYYSLGTLKQLLNDHGLEVFGVETNDVNGGSFRTYIAHRSRFSTRKSVQIMEQEENRLFSRQPSIYTTFAQNIRTIKSSLTKFIKDHVDAGETVYVYGASTRGNTILQYCGLDHELIRKATDANPEKWGRRTPGTLIPIISKDDARKDNPDYFLILPHHFLEEIKREEEAYLRAGGKFIVPLPEPRIVTQEGTQSL